MNICVFGDSIAAGYYDNKKGGWVNRLKEMFPDDEIFNFGISGCMTKDVLKRFDKNIFGKKPDLIIFAIGVNDSMYLEKQKKNQLSFDKFQENIQEFIIKSKKFCSNIIFVGLVRADEDLVSPVPWRKGMGWHYLNKEIEKYDEAIRNICQKENLKFIDINQEMKKIDYKKLLKDGLHPNSRGHEWMANIILGEIKNII